MCLINTAVKKYKKSVSSPGWLGVYKHKIHGVFKYIQPCDILYMFGSDRNNKFVAIGYS